MSMTAVLWAFLLMAPQVRAALQQLTLWQEGEDKYRELVATVEHIGSCQPECDEEVMLQMPPDVRYVLRIEVLLADMHSAAEHVTVRLGGNDVLCNPMPTSDYKCSLTTCAEKIVVGPAGPSGLHVHASGQRMRDTCKCAVEGSGAVDCYSMLVSGLDETYGLLVRLTFTPLADVRWVTGPWKPCLLKDCVEPTSVSKRTVQCFMVDSGSGSGAGGYGITPDSPSWHRCAPSAPASERSCAETPECASPPLCRGCFSLAIVVQPNLRWSHMASTQSMSDGWSLSLDDSEYLEMRLAAGMADDSGISLSSCAGGHKVVHDGSKLLDHTSSLILAADSQSIDIDKRSTFYLRHIAAAIYTFDNPYRASTVVVEGKKLCLTNHTVSDDDPRRYDAMFTAWDADGLCGLVAPGDMSRYSCQFSHGWCCSNPLDKDGRALCQIGDESLHRRECPSSGCSSPGYALLSKGRCEDVGCTHIKDHARCEAAVQSFGLRLLGGVRATAELIITSYQPSFCVWEPESINNEGAALWFNVQSTTLSSTSEFRQVCQCGVGESDTMRYIWTAGDWSDCSLSCGQQQRTRSVLCVARGGKGSSDLEVPATYCREAGLDEPSSSEPCTTPVCFKAQANTRCGGKERVVDPSEIGPMAKRIEGVSGGQHCVELQSEAIVAELVNVCRRSCSRMGDCTGFTFYGASRSSRKYAQCCFLQRATRWQTNFGRAVCHLAHGHLTHGGCTCQVGWSHDSASGGRSVCGAGRGGCCTTPESGAVPWCPTTSSSCGTHSQGQQHWDFCDPRGLAVISANTCSSNPFLARRGCVSARSVSQCNQIATALGLPGTMPTVTLSMHMPSACVWQKGPSHLWLNQLVGAVNATNPSHFITVHASPEYLELCSCPPEGFRWVVGEWSPCFRDPATSCGARKRSRSIFCIREGAHGNDGSGDVVADKFCATQHPPTREELCTDCSKDVVLADVQFDFQRPQRDLQSQTLEKACQENFAWAMGIEAERVRVNAVACCAEPVLHLDLLVSGPAPGDALERLIKIARSPLDRARFQWSSWFRPFATHLSLRVLGVYSWETTGEWSGCDAQCGGGRQRREVSCIFRDHKLPPAQATSELSCDEGTRPEVERVCAPEPCRDCPGIVLGSHYAASGGGVRMPHGSSVYVTCAAGFATVDDVMLVGSTCDDGRWTPLGVSCGRSCPPFNYSSWKYGVKGTGHLHGATRQVWCLDHSPSTVVEVPPSATVVCEDGFWSRPVLGCTGDCQEIELSDAYLVNEVNSRDGGSYAPHDAVRHVACAPGFSSSAPGFSSSNGTVGIELVCNEGQWSPGSMNIPDCKADCPEYELLEGYEVDNGSTFDTEHPVDAQESRLVENESASVPAGREEGNASFFRSPWNPSGVRHGTYLSIVCAHGYTRMPGVVERVQCIDGQWSMLSLVCHKNCPLFNISSLNQWRYRVVLQETPAEHLASESSSQSVDFDYGVVHGSVVTIGCWRPGNAQTVVATAAEREELRCENGLWSTPQLECFHSCPPFVAETQYVVSMLGMMHGARLLATCADGFSSFSIDESSTLSNHTQQAPSASLIDEAECVDGNWTSLSLRCIPDCPPLRPGPALVVSGEGSKAGSLRNIACGAYTPQSEDSKEVIVRCSEAGAWHLAEMVGYPALLRMAEMPLDLEHIPLDCLMPPVKASRKLSGSEKGWVIALAVSFSFAFCGFMCSFVASRRLSAKEKTRAAENGGRGTALSSFEDTDPLEAEGSTFFSSFDDSDQLDTEAREQSNDPERKVSSRSLSQFAGRLSEAACRRLQSAQVQQQSTEALDLPMCQCGLPATHMCFPCNHVALCVSCAGEVMHKSLAGDVARCTTCSSFVDCAIDARPAPVFEAPRSLVLRGLQQLRERMLQQLSWNSSQAVVESSMHEAEDCAPNDGQAEDVHGSASPAARDPQLWVQSPASSSQSKDLHWMRRI